MGDSEEGKGKGEWEEQEEGEGGRGRRERRGRKWLVYSLVTQWTAPCVPSSFLSLQYQRTCTSMREKITPSPVMQTGKHLTSS